MLFVKLTNIDDKLEVVATKKERIKRMEEKEGKTKEIKVIFFFGGFQSKKEAGTTRSAKVQ